jgi:predicted AlkP superfamily phosphohydrolase/phosphomutase
VSGTHRGSETSAADRRQVVYLALDACDAGLATQLARQGHMPTLARLLAESAHVATRAPAGVFVSANWPTLVTGLDPTRHGYLCWKQLVPGTYRDEQTSPRQIAGRPLWERLSDTGRRVAVVDVPHTHAPEQLNGLMVVEWGCHDRHFGTHSHPAGLVDELNDRFGAHPVGTVASPHPGVTQFAPCDYLHRTGIGHRTPDQQRALWRTLVDAQERKRKASLDLLDREPWDLFMSVLGESHCTGHQFWAVHDTDHPWHDRAVRAEIGDPMVEMYGRLDAAVADHLDRVAPDALVYLHLPHGMGPHYDGTHVLDDVLRRLAAVEHAGLRQQARNVASVVVGAGAGAQRSGPAVSGLVRARLAGHEPAPDLGPDPDPDGYDRATRPWFAIPNNTVSGAVRLNLIGREPRGMIAPGADAEAAYERLERGLRELINADTGEPVVADVVRTDAVYERRPDDALPDLLVEWNRRRPIERVWSPRIGLVERAATHWRTGDHNVNGLLLARGPGIEPGDKGCADIVHVGVTLAAAVGVPMDDVDGRPIPGLLPGSSAGRGAPGGAPGASDVPAAADQQPPTPGPAGDPGRRDPVAGGAGPGSAALAATARRTVRLARRALDATGRSARRTIDARLVAHANSLAGRLDLLGDAHHSTRALADDAASRVRDTEAATGELAARVARLERETAIQVVTGWVAAAEVPAELLVSIVLPTRNRATFVPRAIASVLAQVYDHWELLVVDDGSTDATAEVLAAVSDPRVRVLRTEGVGCAAARNVALEVATGDVVAYLDDDNTLDPLWCKAVAWAFGQRPEVDVVYGARMIDDIDRISGRGSGSQPTVQFEPFDRDTLERGNIVDMGVIAHRNGLPEGHFDPDLDAHADWDLFLRLTERRTPAELAVVACHYTSDAPGRLSDGDLSDMERVRAKLTARAAAPIDTRPGTDG